MRKIIAKLKEVGVRNFFVGCIKRIYYILLQKKIGFDPWHTAPWEHRKYIIETTKYINRFKPLCVVDIGCGIGDTLRKIHAKKMYGYDISTQALEAAKYLSKTAAIDYRQGTFDVVKVTGEIDYVLALGFMHGNDEGYWKRYFDILCSTNNVKNIIVDIFPYDSEKGWRHLDFGKILPDDYKKIQVLGPFKAFGGDGRKWVEVWSKR